MSGKLLAVVSSVQLLLLFDGDIQVGDNRIEFWQAAGQVKRPDLRRQALQDLAIGVPLFDDGAQRGAEVQAGISVTHEDIDYHPLL